MEEQEWEENIYEKKMKMEFCIFIIYGFLSLGFHLLFLIFLFLDGWIWFEEND